MTATVLGVIIAAMGLVVTILFAALKYVSVVSKESARTTERLVSVADDIEKLVRDKDRTHSELASQMREDRLATNERLTYLERHAWPHAKG